MKRCAGCIMACCLAPAAFGQVAVKDDTDRVVALPQPARRIVTLSPHATELVFAAAAGDRLVAVAAYSDWPPAARQLPRIGGSGGIDRERLLRLQPDLVVAWASGSRPGDLAWLERLGIAVYRSEPRRLSDIADNLRALGRLAGTAAAADRMAASFEQALADACPERTSETNVLYRLWEQPLLTYGGRHWSNDALRRLGLHNMFAAVARAVFTPDREAVLAAQPTYVLGQSATTDPLLTARFLPTPAAFDRPTPRIVEALRSLCASLPASD